MTSQRLPDRKLPSATDSLRLRARKLTRAVRHYDKHGWPCEYGDHMDAWWSAVKCLDCGL